MKASYFGGATIGRRLAPVAAVVALALALVPAAARAVPGDLDPSFAKIGKFTGGSAAEAVAVQPDGKTLVLSTNRIIRLTEAGVRETPFGGRKDGSAENGIPVGYSGPGGDDVLVQPDGKILVAGYTDTADTASFAVARLLSDGKLDSAFGSSGVATVALEGSGSSGDSDPPARLALQADGRIVVAGGREGTPQVARLTGAGAPDPSFSADGSVAVELGPSDRFADVAVDGDRVVVAGSVNVAAKTSDFAVARLAADGTLDPSFSGDGIQTTDLGAKDTAAGVAVQAGGLTVVAGRSANCTTSPCDDRFAVARYTSAGDPDPGFAGSGTTTAKPPRGVGAHAAGMVLQADGKIVVAGGENDFLVARFDADGSLDAGFGDDGLTWTPFLGSYPAYGSAVALSPDGKLVVAGLVYLEEYYDSLTIARYEAADGPTDTDADGLTDRKDGCPRTWGSHRSGCPVIKRKIRLDYKRRKGVLSGHTRFKQVSGEDLAGYRAQTASYCVGNSGGRIILYERRRGPDRKVESDRSSGSFKLKLRGSGRFYAAVKKARVTVFDPDGPAELCGSAKSPGISTRH